MFQKRRLSIVLALLLTVILTLTGCSSSVANKAVDNAKAFADQKNFEQAAQTLHSAEKELGSNLGPKELKALTSAYSYIIVKIAENAKTEADNGNFEKAFTDIDSSSEIINLPPSMSLTAEATEAVKSARIEIAKKCLKTASDGKILAISIKLFNVASKSISRGDNAPVTPELQKTFDDARIKITELPVPSLIKILNGGNFAQSESTIKAVENLDKSISSAQSDKFTEIKELFLTKKTQADINLRLAQAEQYLTQRSELYAQQTAQNVRGALTNLYDDPAYRKFITKEQTQRYNAIALSLNILLDKAEKYFSEAPGWLNPLRIPVLALPSQ